MTSTTTIDYSRWAGIVRRIVAMRTRSLAAIRSETLRCELESKLMQSLDNVEWAVGSVLIESGVSPEVARYFAQQFVGDCVAHYRKHGAC